MKGKCQRTEGEKELYLTSVARKYRGKESRLGDINHSMLWYRDGSVQ